jgi:hypothetical protein
VFLTLRHSDLILKVDTVRAYHWGEDLFAEVGIFMSPDCSLCEAHDVSQELQDKLKTVDGFGRAYQQSIRYEPLRTVCMLLRETPSNRNLYNLLLLRLYILRPIIERRLDLRLTSRLPTSGNTS